METNGITIPDESSSTEFITDEVGGFMYQVITSVRVIQHRLDDIQQQIDAAHAQIVSAQDTIDKLSPARDAIAKKKQ